MKELWLRLKSTPFVSFQLLIASVMANLLAFASPIFVILVLNRYIGSGIDATLVTLTSGVVIAIIFEFLFRFMRLRLIGAINEKRNQNLMVGTFGMMLSAKLGDFNTQDAGQRREVLKGLETIEAAYAPANLTALLDLPFALVFVFSLFLLAPSLALVVVVFVCLALIIGALHQHYYKKDLQKLLHVNATGNQLISNVNQIAPTIRGFNLQDLLMTKWKKFTVSSLAINNKIKHGQGTVQSLTTMLQALMGAGIYTIGAMLVVKGELDIGTLIGANILATRSFGPILQFSRLGPVFSKAKMAVKAIEMLAELPIEKQAGSSLQSYKGELKLKNIVFNHLNSGSPLFEKLNLDIAAGSVLMVVGSSGRGKTTLLQIIAGLYEPEQGQILIDDVDLQQVSISWWRQQLIYLPQEPVFISGTIYENFGDASLERIQDAINHTGLGKFLDTSSDGLETKLQIDGANLPFGIRHRLALARALLTDGSLVLFDDPTEGMDQEGRLIFLRNLKRLSEQGKTIVIATNDPSILRGARHVLNLDEAHNTSQNKMEASRV